MWTRAVQRQNILEGMVSMVSGKVTELSLSQELKALTPANVSDFVSLREERPLHDWKASEPIKRKQSGSSMDEIPSQY